MALLITGRIAVAQEPAPGDLAEPQEVDSEIGGSDVAQVDAIVVTATRTEQRLADSPVATEVITRQDIEQSGAENAAELLEEHPGLQVVRSFRGAALRVQGLDPDYVLVLVDGERTTGRIGGAIDLQRYPAEDIERVELVRGASSALYGSDAIGGVINIITRRCRDPEDQERTGPEAELHGTYGSYETTDLSVIAGYCGQRWNSRLSAGYHHRGSYDLDSSDLATNGSAFDQYNIDQRTEYQPTDDLSLVGKAGYNLRNSQGVDANAAGAVFDRDNRTETFSASLRPQLEFSDASKLQFLAHYSQFRDQFRQDQRGSDALDQYQDTREQLFELTTQYDRPLLQRHLLVVGVEGYHQRLQSQRLDDGEGHRSRLATYLQDEWAVLDEPLLVLVPGARLDIDTQFGTRLSPKIAVRLDPVDTVVLRASYGRGFRAPSFQELLLRFENPSAGYVVEGNPDLGPETSQSINLGAEYQPGDWARLSLNLYRNDVDNLITNETIEDPGAGNPQRIGYVNIATAYTQGVEVVTRVLPFSGLRVELSYTLTDTRDVAQERPLEGRALHRGSFDVRYELAAVGIEATARAAVVGKRPFYADEDGDEVDETRYSAPYTSLDLRLAKHLWDKHLTLLAGVENLLDAGEAELLPLPPRTIYAGATARY